MKSFISLLSYIFLLSLYISGCSEDNGMSVGSDLVVSKSNATIVDTVTISLSTVKTDTIITSSHNIALVGQTEIAGYGAVNAKSYIPLEYNTFIKYNKEEIFDSLTISFYLSGYYKGDTLANLNLKIYEVTDSFIVNSQRTYSSTTSFYSTKYWEYKFDNLNHKSEPLFERNIKVRPSTTKEHEYKLSNEIFNRLTSFVKTATADSTLEGRFFGIAIDADSLTTKCVLGLSVNDSSCCFNLYSHTISESKTTIVRKFNLLNSQQQFYSVKNTSNYPELNQNQIHKYKITDKKTDNQSVLAGLAGYEIRIDFPYLKQLLEISNQSYLMNAILIIKPNMDLCSVNSLPNSIYLATTNKLNEITGYFKDSDNNYLTGDLVTDIINKENTYYSFNITSYLHNAIENSYFTDGEGLMLTLPDNQFSTTFNSIIIGGFSNTKYKSHLNIYYYNVNK
ncbi:MAG: DUF4270 family protein [Marinilabiliaceae bacterium]|nr:DUF4270 family protein [Marinilabiliaceae bacterium]